MIEIKKDIDFLVITGPTAVGKTDVSIKIAKENNGEIINGDSVQVYKGMDIGSAKIKEEEKAGIIHHLIDIKDPSEEYSVYDFKKDCEKKIKEIRSRGKLPIIVGGTGLYIKSVVYDYEFDDTLFKDEKLKKKLNEMTNEQLFEICFENCKKNKIEIHKNNRIRLVNYAYKTLKAIDLKQDKLKMKNTQIVFLNQKRADLYGKIELRVDKMIQSGLLLEVNSLNREWPSQKAIGYKEVHEYLNGEIDKQEMIHKIKKNTKRFAKRQITWFNNQMEVDQYLKEEDTWQRLMTH